MGWLVGWLVMGWDGVGKGDGLIGIGWLRRGSGEGG